MGHKKSIGLPGGPNEFLQDITQYISIEGYKNDSPDKNNPVNIIESSNITMEGVDFPVRGYGNNGVVQDMTPGTPHYDYGNADYVVEVPMAQDGTEIPDEAEAAASNNSFLYDLEKLVNKSLGDINNKAKDFSENPEEMNNIDNMRHASGGRYAAEAIQQKVKDIPYLGGLLDFVGVDKAAGFIGSNAMGVGHELRTIFGGDERPFLAKLQEMGEDTFNNYVGSIVGSLGIDDSKKDEVIRYLSYNNLLPDGYVRTEQGKKDGFSEDIYFKDEDGKRKTAYQRGGALPKAQDGDETSSERSLPPSLEKQIDGLDLSKYNVRVIQYPYGSKKFSPGHIESVLIDKKTGRQVNKISGTNLAGYINRWAGPGNRRVTQGDYEQEEDVRTVDLNLSESEIKNFITEAQLFTGTNKGKEHSKSGLNVRNLPLSINDDDIYDYDFVDSNCATGVCMGLGMDPNSPENTQAGITDPNLVMDGILSKYNDFIVPGSSTGYRTSREDGLRNLVKDNLGENVNAGTIDVLTNYLDGLNRDDINNTLESILQNPTALKILKDDGDLSKIGDRAFRDLTSLFNANFNPFVDVDRGREQMATNRLKKIQRDVVNMYESIPEGTIPAALEALNEQYIEPNNPFDVSLEGVKNIPGWWKNKLGFKEGGSTSWNWKGKSYSGTLIPSMETETNRYARTENGKIKTLPKKQDGGCSSCTESMRQREGSYNKGKEYILDPRFKQEGGSTTNPYTIYMNYINGIDESEVAQNIFDKLNRMHYRDAKTRGMGVANYIASNIIPNS